MPNKSLILTIAAAIIAFGVLMSGCNRDKRTAMNDSRDRRAAQPSRNTRPAEVLSAQAYRPAERYYSEPSPQTAYVPVQSSFVGPVYTDPSLSQAPLYVPAGQPMPMQPSPELAMARATLPPPPPSARGITPIRQVPIPELEPVRYQRQGSRSSGRPVAEVMMSANQDLRRQEIQRALEPLALAPAAPGHGWVSSPATAMRNGYY